MTPRCLQLEPAAAIRFHLQDPTLQQKTKAKSVF